MRKLCLLAMVLLLAPVWADIVQLTRPGEMVITLQPGTTRALVRETRPLQLPAGRSAVSFSWGKANIDSSSVGLSLDEGTVGEATRPPGQDKTLVWQVDIPQAGPVAATVAYFIDGAKWQPRYVLTLDAGADKALLEGYLSLTNETGADLRQVSLQVGVPGVALADQPEAARGHESFSVPATIAPGETSHVVFTTIKDIPATMRYVYQAERYGGPVEQILRLGLDQVGVAAVNLPDGPMLIGGAGYQPAQGRIVSGPSEPALPIFKTQLDFQPGKEFEVDMGPEPDIVLERKLVAGRRSNFDFDRFGKVAGLDTQEEYRIVARNHLAHDLTLEITETVLSTWDLKGPEPVKRETSSVQWDVPVKAAGEAELRFTLVKHAGTRAK